MQVSTITCEQLTELMEESVILRKCESTSSITYHLHFQNQQAVLINTAIETYFIKGDK